MEKKIYRLCETVADIAYLAGDEHYYGGDSREDAMKFIQWAEEFESLYPYKDEDDDPFDGDYIGAIQAFVMAKLGDPQIDDDGLPRKKDVVTGTTYRVAYNGIAIDVHDNFHKSVRAARDYYHNSLSHSPGCYEVMQCTPDTYVCKLREKKKKAKQKNGGVCPVH